MAAVHGVRLLTVSGSLQARSSNRGSLDAASIVARAAGTTVDNFDRLSEIPAFDADRTDEPIDVVDDWRGRVRSADVVLAATPEYAGAMAGVLKNAFDWLVSSGELYRKPIAVLSAGTSGGLHARRMLAQTLTWQGAYVIAELGIESARTKFDGRHLSDAGTATAIASLTHTLLGAVAMPAGEIVALATHVVGSLGIDTVHIVPAL